MRSRSILAIAIALPAALWCSTAAVAQPCPGPTPHQQSMAGEVNFARVRPQEFVAVLEAHLATIDDEGIVNRPDGKMRTREGRRAVEEAIAFLRTARGLPPLRLNACLSLAADDHVREQGPTGSMGHYSVDGRSPSQRASARVGRTAYCSENIQYGRADPRQIVVQLIVDDGVASRGHRTNIFRPESRSIGVAAGPHSRWGGMAVQVFCTDDLGD